MKEIWGSSSPLVNPGRDPSLLPSGRIHRPGSPAVQCPGVPPARLAPCLHRPSCHPPARAGVTGITSLLLLSPSRTHRLPGLSFLAHSHPSLPRRPGVLHSSQTPPRPLVPNPAAPTSHLPQLVGPVPHGGSSSLSPAPEPGGPQDSKFGTPVSHSHSDTPLRPHPADPKTAPHEPPEALSLAPSTVKGKEPTSGTPKFPQVGIPFSSPPLPLQ